jgi:integrase
VLGPVAEEANVGWAGFHTFRHTFASLHLAGGANIVQVSRLLGHHSPAFTLRVYAHLIPCDELPTLNVSAELAEGNGWATRPAEKARESEALTTEDLAV